MYTITSLYFLPIILLRNVVQLFRMFQLLFGLQSTELHLRKRCHQQRRLIMSPWNVKYYLYVVWCGLELQFQVFSLVFLVIAHSAFLPTVEKE